MGGDGSDGSDGSDGGLGGLGGIGIGADGSLGGFGGFGGDYGGGPSTGPGGLAAGGGAASTGEAGSTTGGDNTGTPGGVSGFGSDYGGINTGTPGGVSGFGSDYGGFADSTASLASEADNNPAGFFGQLASLTDPSATVGYFTSQEAPGSIFGNLPTTGVPGFATIGSQVTSPVASLNTDFGVVSTPLGEFSINPADINAAQEGLNLGFSITGKGPTGKSSQNQSQQDALATLSQMAKENPNLTMEAPLDPNQLPTVEVTAPTPVDAKAVVPGPSTAGKSSSSNLPTAPNSAFGTSLQGHDSEMDDAATATAAIVGEALAGKGAFPGMAALGVTGVVPNTGIASPNDAAFQSGRGGVFGAGISGIAPSVSSMGPVSFTNVPNAPISYADLNQQIANQYGFSFPVATFPSVPMPSFPQTVQNQPAPPVVSLLPMHNPIPQLLVPQQLPVPQPPVPMPHPNPPLTGFSKTVSVPTPVVTRGEDLPAPVEKGKSAEDLAKEAGKTVNPNPPPQVVAKPAPVPPSIPLPEPRPDMAPSLAPVPAFAGQNLGFTPGQNIAAFYGGDGGYDPSTGRRIYPQGQIGSPLPVAAAAPVLNLRGVNPLILDKSLYPLWWAQNVGTAA